MRLRDSCCGPPQRLSSLTTSSSPTWTLVSSLLQFGRCCSEGRYSLDYRAQKRWVILSSAINASATECWVADDLGWVLEWQPMDCQSKKCQRVNGLRSLPSLASGVRSGIGTSFYCCERRVEVFVCHRCFPDNSLEMMFYSFDSDFPESSEVRWSRWNKMLSHEFWQSAVVFLRSSWESKRFLSSFSSLLAPTRVFPLSVYMLVHMPIWMWHDSELLQRHLLSCQAQVQDELLWLINIQKRLYHPSWWRHFFSLMTWSRLDRKDLTPYWWIAYRLLICQEANLALRAVWSLGWLGNKSDIFLTVSLPLSGQYFCLSVVISNWGAAWRCLKGSCLIKRLVKWDWGDRIMGCFWSLEVDAFLSRPPTPISPALPLMVVTIEVCLTA